jgi:hypothetical protein
MSAAAAQAPSDEGGDDGDGEQDGDGLADEVFDLGVSGAGEVAEQLVADAPGPAADGCVRA